VARLLITAGPTREYIDTVRYLTNASSGRLGYAIARQANQAGHQVTLVTGPVALVPPPGVEVVSVVSAAEMFDACVAGFEMADAAVLAAAVCDYRPARRQDRKLKKQGAARTLDLEPTRDICAHLGSIKAQRVVVGFALEDHDLHHNAEAKLRQKHCDAIVLNDVDTIGGDQTSIQWLVAGETWSEPVAGSKDRAAAEVVRLVERLLGRSGELVRSRRTPDVS
jgi:phosphopantothenoylcysteine decarboxylase/phosphopantothenate--cysteine ligase